MSRKNGAKFRLSALRETDVIFNTEMKPKDQKYLQRYYSFVSKPSVLPT